MGHRNDAVGDHQHDNAQRRDESAGCQIILERQPVEILREIAYHLDDAVDGEDAA